MGYVSQMCITDEEKAEQFIHECYSQCHNEEAYRFWGEDLVKDIASYCNTVVQVRA
ncbi:MAG: hypothetical protein JWO32_1729 [Bacteroidetes bacterium]|nr:hypothetical protein [Bacteroidota bacterium]